MFDPTEFICGGRYGHIVRYCRTDYMQGSPLIERLNPLRYEIGVGVRPRRLVLNRGGRLAIKWANFNWWLWKRRAWERRRVHDSDTHRMAETGTGSGRSLSSAGRQASPENPNENT